MPTNDLILYSIMAGLVALIFIVKIVADLIYDLKKSSCSRSRDSNDNHSMDDKDPSQIEEMYQ